MLHLRHEQKGTVYTSNAAKRARYEGILLPDLLRHLRAYSRHRITILDLLTADITAYHADDDRIPDEIHALVAAKLAQ